MAKYVGTFFRHLTWFTVVFPLLPLGLSVTLIALSPTEQAGASLWAETPAFLDVAATPTSGWDQLQTPAANASDILTQLVQTQSFQGQVSARLDSSNAWQTGQERASTLGAYGTNLKVSVTGSHLVSLTYTCSRADLCVQVLRATVDLYKQTLDREQQQRAKVASVFYTSQLQQAQAALRSDQAALDAYLAKNPGLRQVDPSPSNPMAPAQYVQLSAQVQADQAYAQSLHSKLDDANLNSSGTNGVVNSAIRVVDGPAALPTGVLSSVPLQQLAIIWAACLAFGLVLLVVLRRFDRTAGEPHELERALQVRVVTKIPLVKPRARL